MAIFAILLSLGAINAVLRFPDQFDFLAYHLPSALHFFGLTTFTPSRFCGEIIAGHPPLGQLLMGALIAATGRISAATLIGTISLLVFALGFYRISGWGRQARWLVLCVLSLPLAVIHLYAPYVDLWMGAWIALALFTVVHSLDQGLTKKASFAFCLCVGVGAWTKLQAWPILGLLWLWAAAHWGHAAFARRTLSRRLVLLTLGVSAALLVSWPLLNWLRFQNPTHPWQTPLIGQFVNHGGYVMRLIEQSEPDTPRVLQEVSRPLRFAYSVFEAGRWLRPEMHYTHDMWNDFPEANMHHRVGGWGIWSVILILGWWTHWLLSRHPAALRTTALFLMLCAGIAIIPRSHELRYWLFLPLGAFACLIYYDFRFITQKPWALLLCLVLTYVTTREHLLHPGKPSLPVAAPAAAREFWATAQRDLIYQSPPVSLPIFWAGEDFNTFTISPSGTVRPAQPNPGP